MINNTMTRIMRKEKIIAGAMHYFRIMPEQWEDRIEKLKLMGCNTLETYMAWNLHEKREGEFDFSGMLDFLKYIEIANRHGLYVILRPGPYICSECDWGGLPWWLQRYDVDIRSCDEKYLFYAFRFLDKVCEMIQPYLAKNGGPIIGVQVENEYGDAYVGDGEYLKKVRDRLIANGVEDLFTSGWPAGINMKSGSTEEVLHTINFRGLRANERIATLKGYRPDDPTMVMEYWTGRATKFEVSFGHRNAKECAQYLDDILSADTSVNIYCVHGGTNFGFFNGANYEEQEGKMRTVFQATSYDGDFPINEYGQITEKYMLEKAVIEKHTGKKLALPSDVKTASYGKYGFNARCDLLANADSLKTAEMKSVKPKTMDKVGEGHGYILYTTKLWFKENNITLSIEDVHDRASVYINGDFLGVIERDENQTLKFDATEDETRIDIFVENLGRINFGKEMETDYKGIVGNVCLNGRPIHGFTNTCFPLEKLPDSGAYGKLNREIRPAFYKASFTVGEIADTFVYPEGFTRGVVFINGFNIGRYFEGSFRSLYVPYPLLKKGENEIVVFDAIADDREKSVEFKDYPSLCGESRFPSPFECSMEDNTVKTGK